MKIYIVEGQTGEYSDRTEWSVKAFASEEKAKALVVALAAWCDEQGCGENPTGDTYEARDKGHPLDPSFRCSYDGTRYTYYPVDFDEDEPDPSGPRCACGHRCKETRDVATMLAKLRRVRRVYWRVRWTDAAGECSTSFSHVTNGDPGYHPRAFAHQFARDVRCGAKVFRVTVFEKERS